MRSINFDGFPKDITIGEILEMEKLQGDLPKGFVIQLKSKVAKNFAEELVEEIKE